LNERLQELENQKFLLEQARAEKKSLSEEAEALKREIGSLKKVKDKLFLEIQRMKVPAPPAPTRKAGMQESEVQTDKIEIVGIESSDERVRRIVQLEYQVKEVQEVNFQKDKVIKELNGRVSAYEAKLTQNDS
jgi:predicted  nucleic acid-binding Zn-ribbon protein